MTSLVTIDEACAHLYKDPTDDDVADVNLKMEAASEAIIDYLKWDTVPDVIPSRVKQATLIMLGELYAQREGGFNQVPAQFGYGYLPVGVTALLYSLRDPTAV